MHKTASPRKEDIDLGIIPTGLFVEAVFCGSSTEAQTIVDLLWHDLTEKERIVLCRYLQRNVPGPRGQEPKISDAEYEHILRRLDAMMTDRLHLSPGKRAMVV